MRFLLIAIACVVFAGFAQYVSGSSFCTPAQEWFFSWIVNISLALAVIAVVCDNYEEGGVNNHLWGNVTRIMAKTSWYVGIVATFLCLTIYAVVGPVPGALFVPFPAILALMIAAWMTEQVYNGGLVY